MILLKLKDFPILNPPMLLLSRTPLLLTVARPTELLPKLRESPERLILI